MGLTSIIVETVSTNITPVLVFSVIFTLFWRYQQTSPYKYPPMLPWKLPFIGHLTFFNAKSTGEHEFWEASKSMDSPIITVHLGRLPILILHSYEDVKECFSNEDFMGRIKDVLKDVFNGLLRDGPQWKEQRRFALHALRDLGLGKNRMEHQIQDECRHLTKYLDEYLGKPMNPTMMTNTVSSNIICAMVFGHRFDYSDLSFKRMMFLMNENFTKNMRKAILGSFIPGTKFIPGDFFCFKKLADNIEEIKGTILRPEYEEHLKTYDPNNIGDFIHAFIREQISHENSTEEHWFNSQQLMWNMDDLFSAGTETTATTLRWAFLCMIHHPKVQKRVRAEILEAIGAERLPSMHDKKLLSYTEATINEIQRMCLITPLGGPIHVTEHTTQFKLVLGPWPMSMQYTMTLNTGMNLSSLNQRDS
ncbi:unnamed protein product [Owenia fusiformis]|uniref:Uncharacterized protein n=1 Tax=Owenia fusiformis TaxID=6347 RepID=A0A8J1XJ86_OWEFU|nr:unnamed protein product [Owenia fusiformis]